MRHAGSFMGGGFGGVARGAWLRSSVGEGQQGGEQDEFEPHFSRPLPKLSKGGLRSRPSARRCPTNSSLSHVVDKAMEAVETALEFVH
jgi:hypothetical protein